MLPTIKAALADTAVNLIKDLLVSMLHRELECNRDAEGTVNIVAAEVAGEGQRTRIAYCKTKIKRLHGNNDLSARTGGIGGYIKVCIVCIDRARRLGRSELNISCIFVQPVCKVVAIASLHGDVEVDVSVTIIRDFPKLIGIASSVGAGEALHGRIGHKDCLVFTLEGVGLSGRLRVNNDGHCS